MKEYVLITGASSGIGYEFAKIFVTEGYPLVMVSSNKERLQQAYEQLKKHAKADIRMIARDLSQVGSAQDLYNIINEQQLEIGILINNAGVGYAGELIKDTLSNQQDMMTLNMTNLVLLTQLFAKDMCRRKRGRILNVASNGAFQPGPYISTYYATKSFVLNFSEALRYELLPYKVKVTTLCPGATVSDFARRAGKQQLACSMSASKVARIGYQGLMRGKSVVLPGIQNKLALLIPKALRTRAIAKKYQPSVNIKNLDH